MFELLPETGLVLPRAVGLLRFGMPARAARWTVATLADVRESWACGAGWTFSARYEGLELLVAGDLPDREGRTESDRPGLALVSLRRCERDPAEPSRRRWSSTASTCSGIRRPRWRAPCAAVPQ